MFVKTAKECALLQSIAYIILLYRFKKGRCYLGDKCTFAHGTEEQAYWIKLHERLSQHLSQLQKERLLTECFSEKVRRQVKCEGAPNVVSNVSLL